MKAIINALNKELTIHLNKKRKGIYWNYDGVDMSYGPFRSDQQAINDAKLYSQYGTTSKAHIWDPFWTRFDLFLTHFSRNAHYWESITCFYWELKNVLKNRFAWARRRLWRYLRGSLEYLCCLRPQPQKSQATQWHFENWHRLSPFSEFYSYNY